MNTFDDDIIIHPVKTKRDRGIPKTGVLFVNPGEANTAIDLVLDGGGKRLFLHNSKLALTDDSERFAAGPCLGAAAAVLIIEKLIVLGAKRIVQMGWCGAVDSSVKVGDIVIADGAECGEGVSQYYRGEKSSRQSGPSANLHARLADLFKKHGRVVKTGSIWSTDAPYRESRSMLKELHQISSVIGVDMEFSAICSVAAFRGIEFASVMVVSDELLGDKWNPGFKDPVFRDSCKKVMKTLLNERI